MPGSETPWGPDVFRLIDEHVGFRLRERREALGVPRSRFADFLYVCTITLVKYETGELSIPASNLYDAADFLGVPMEYFYEGLDEQLAAVANSNVTPFTRAAR
jgi:transcriptional regulator with XRE-family HTH domain